MSFLLEMNIIKFKFLKIYKVFIVWVGWVYAASICTKIRIGLPSLISGVFAGWFSFNLWSWAKCNKAMK